MIKQKSITDSDELRPNLKKKKMKFTSDCADCFAGLSAKARLEIVSLLLKKKALSVTEITDYFELKQPTITHHLQYLKEAGIVDSRKKGRRVFYFLTQKCKEGKCGLFI